MTGGRVLEYEGKRIFNEGAVYQKGKNAVKLCARGDSVEEIAEIVELPINLVMRWTKYVDRNTAQACFPLREVAEYV